MPISFPFHGKILPRYSEINKFKDLTFQKKQKHTKKVGLKGNFKYKKAVCFTGNSL